MEADKKLKRVIFIQQQKGKVFVQYDLITLFTQQQIKSWDEGGSSMITGTKEKEQQVIESLKVCMQAHILKFIHKKNEQKKFEYIMVPIQKPKLSQQINEGDKHYYFEFPKGMTIDINKKILYFDDKIVQPKKVAIMAIKLIRDLTQSLKQLQQNAIYHADIRLRNIIFLAQQKRFKLIDFGECFVFDSSFSIAYRITKVIKKMLKLGQSVQNEKTHKNQLIELLQVILSIQEFENHYQYAQIKKWFKAAKKQIDKLLYDDLLKLCVEKIEIMVENEQEIQSNAQSQKAYNIKQQNEIVINSDSRKIVNTQHNALMLVYLIQQKHDLEFDSGIIQSSNICLQLQRITFLHRQLRTKKIRLQSMILKQVYRMATLQYIQRPIEIEQTQHYYQMDSQQDRLITQSKFTFNKGKKCKMFSQQQFQILQDQYFIIQHSLRSKIFYQFILNLCQCILQLQQLSIYNADISLKNIVFVQQKFKIIDFGEALCFNEEYQFEGERNISQECINIINDLKQRREQVLLDYLSYEKKDKFQQYSYACYKSLYKEMHSQQFLRLYETFQSVKDRNYQQQDENIKKYITNMQYGQLIHLCRKKIENLSNVRQESMSQSNKQKSSSQLYLSRGNKNHIFLKQNNKDNSQDEEDFEVQQMILKTIIHIQENAISQKEQMIFFVPLEDNLISYIKQDCRQKDQSQVEHQNQQRLFCDHQTNSKMCLSIKCIQNNKYLLCRCQNGHIDETQLKQCHIVNYKDLSKLTFNIEEKIKQWGSERYYLSLIEAFHTSPLSKIEHYYKQIIQNTIGQLQSLSKYDEIINKQFLSKNIEQKDMALKLSGLYSFSRFTSKTQFDQFIQFTSDSLEQFSSKIIQLAKQQLEILKDKIDEALNCNKSDNQIVKKYLNQKYRTVVDSPSDKGGSKVYYSFGQKNISFCIPLNNIKQHHFSRIENLTVGSQTQQIFEEQSYNCLKKRLQQLDYNNTLNNNWQDQSETQKIQKIRKSLIAEYKQQSYLCKTLKFIIQSNYCNLKSLEIDLNDSKNSNKYEFSQFDLFSLISKTSISNLKVNGVKIVQFQQFIRVLYEFKQNQSLVNRNVIFDDKRDYSYIQKFHKFELLTIQIYIQIRFIFKFKESMKKKKQQLFYFLDHIKQLKSITLTFQFGYQRVDQLSLQLIQELMQHPKIRRYRLNIHKLQVRQYDNTHNLFRTLQKIKQQSNKIVALQFQDVQFGQLERLQTERNAKFFEYMMANILGNNLQQYSVVNCHAFPMINIGKTSLTNLKIFNTKFKTKQIDQKQQRNICNTIQSLWIRNSKQLLQRDIHLISFEKLTYLNITLSHHIQEYLVNQQLPLLKTLIISREKYSNANNQQNQLSKLLYTIQGLEVFKVENILVGSQDIKSIKPSSLRVLKLSHLNVQSQGGWLKVIDLFSNCYQITELSLANIIFEKQQLILKNCQQTFDIMKDLRKLKIDKKIINQLFYIDKLRKRGILTTLINNSQ